MDGFRHLELLVSKGTFKGESTSDGYLMLLDVLEPGIPTISGGDPFHKSIEDFVRESKEKCASKRGSSDTVLRCRLVEPEPSSLRELSIL